MDKSWTQLKSARVFFFLVKFCFLGPSYCERTRPQNFRAVKDQWCEQRYGTVGSSISKPASCELYLTSIVVRLRHVSGTLLILDTKDLDYPRYFLENLPQSPKFSTEDIALSFLWFVFRDIVLLPSGRSHFVVSLLSFFKHIWEITYRGSILHFYEVGVICLGFHTWLCKVMYRQKKKTN